MLRFSNCCQCRKFLSYVNRSTGKHIYTSNPFQIKIARWNQKSPGWIVAYVILFDCIEFQEAQMRNGGRHKCCNMNQRNTETTYIGLKWTLKLLFVFFFQNMSLITWLVSVSYTFWNVQPMGRSLYMRGNLVCQGDP